MDDNHPLFQKNVKDNSKLLYTLKCAARVPKHLPIEVIFDEVHECHDQLKRSIMVTFSHNRVVVYRKCSSDPLKFKFVQGESCCENPECSRKTYGHFLEEFHSQDYRGVHISTENMIFQMLSEGHSFYTPDETLISVDELGNVKEVSKVEKVEKVEEMREVEIVRETENMRPFEMDVDELNRELEEIAIRNEHLRRIQTEELIKELVTKLLEK